MHDNKQIYIYTGRPVNLVLNLIIKFNFYINKITVFYSTFLTVFTNVLKIWLKFQYVYYLQWDMNTLFQIKIIHCYIIYIYKTIY